MVWPPIFNSVTPNDGQKVVNCRSTLFRFCITQLLFIESLLHLDDSQLSLTIRILGFAFLSFRSFSRVQKYWVVLPQSLLQQFLWSNIVWLFQALAWNEISGTLWGGFCLIQCKNYFCFTFRQYRMRKVKKLICKCFQIWRSMEAHKTLLPFYSQIFGQNLFFHLLTTTEWERTKDDRSCVYQSVRQRNLFWLRSRNLWSLRKEINLYTTCNWERTADAVGKSYLSCFCSVVSLWRCRNTKISDTQRQEQKKKKKTKQTKKTKKTT